jgi:stage V sporulation protein S
MNFIHAQVLNRVAKGRNMNNIHENETSVAHFPNGNIPEHEGDKADIIKVSAKSRSTAVAGAIAAVIREHRYAEVQAIGAGAVNQAVKALAIARGYLSGDQIDIVCHHDHRGPFCTAQLQQTLQQHTCRVGKMYKDLVARGRSLIRAPIQRQRDRFLGGPLPFQIQRHLEFGSIDPLSADNLFQANARVRLGARARRRARPRDR